MSQLRSGILISAILRTCALVTVPTLLRFGCREPFSMPSSFFRSIAAGGVLMMKVNDLSPKIVTSTGQDHAILALRPGVELLAERHDVDALRAERRTDRRRRVRAPRRDLQLHEPDDFLGHTAPSLRSAATQRAANSHSLFATSEWWPTDNPTLPPRSAPSARRTRRTDNRSRQYAFNCR